MAIWKLRLRVGLPVWCAAIYFASLLATPHKEPRFLMPGLMLLVLAAAPGLAGAIRRWVPGINFRAAWAVALLAGVVTYGLHIDIKDDEIRAVVAATRASQVRGIALVGEAKWNTLAYFFVGKPIALHAVKLNNNDELTTVLASPEFDRVVVARGRWGKINCPLRGSIPSARSSDSISGGDEECSVERFVGHINLNNCDRDLCNRSCIGDPGYTGIDPLN